MSKGLPRSFLAGDSMGDVVCREREETVSMLIVHRLEIAALATRKSPSFSDFYNTRGAMLAGGIHLVRLKGGRGINPPSREPVEKSRRIDVREPQP